MLPSMPDVADDAMPAVGVFSGTLATPVPSDLPADADSLSRAAIDRGGLPIHTWAPGVAVARAQSTVPFTLPRLGLALALLLVVGGLAIRAGDDGMRRKARRGFVLAVVAVIGWVGIACAAALALSQG